MNPSLLLVPLLVAVLDWFALLTDRLKLVSLTKPGVMLALIAVFITAGLQDGLAILDWLVLAGLALSLAGDVLLMPRIDNFIAGLIAFLLALLAYSAALNLNPLPINASTFIFAAIVLTLFARLNPIVQRSLKEKGKTALSVPAMLYALGLTVMLFSALATLARESWAPWPSLAAAFGGLLFYVSDVILAWDRFVAPIENARLKNRIPYHLGQILLVLGFITV